MSMTRVSEPPSVDDFTPSGFELFVGLLRQDGNGWARTFGDWLSVVQKAFDGWAFKEQLEDLLRNC